MSKTKIDRLGQRLRSGPVTDADLRELDSFRRSFALSYSEVTGRLRHITPLETTGRPAKSTSAIIEKLRRETVRLSQIQDIAGVRVVVAGPAEQAQLVSALVASFETVSVSDRRERPSHGYRAVHVIVTASNHPVEIQVRTPLQHRWAELSEKFADVLDPAIKYGGGDEDVRRFLTESSESIASTEALLLRTIRLRERVEEMERQAPEIMKKTAPGLSDEVRDAHAGAERFVEQEMSRLDDLLQLAKTLGQER